MMGIFGYIIRMLLYGLGGCLAGYGFAEFNGITGDLTVNVDSISNGIVNIVVGVFTYFGTALASRSIKKRGGFT